MSKDFRGAKDFRTYRHQCIDVYQLLQLRNSLFSLCKMCNSNGSQKAVLCSLLGTLSVFWTAAVRVQCWCEITCIWWILPDVQNYCLLHREQIKFM